MIARGRGAEGGTHSFSGFQTRSANKQFQRVRREFPILDSILFQATLAVAAGKMSSPFRAISKAWSDFSIAPDIPHPISCDSPAPVRNARFLAGLTAATFVTPANSGSPDRRNDGRRQSAPGLKDARFSARMTMFGWMRSYDPFGGARAGSRCLNSQSVPPKPTEKANHTFAPLARKCRLFRRPAALQKDAPAGGGGACAHDLGSSGFCGELRLAMKRSNACRSFASRCLRSNASKAWASSSSSFSVSRLCSS